MIAITQTVIFFFLCLYWLSYVLLSIIELIAPSTFFQEPRIQQVDIRFTRTFRLNNTRIQPQFDVFNLFNANPVLAIITRYGPAWRNATTVLGPRVMKLGVKVDF